VRQDKFNKISSFISQKILLQFQKLPTTQDQATTQAIIFLILTMVLAE